jgi:hypothetical protein
MIFLFLSSFNLLKPLFTLFGFLAIPCAVYYASPSIGLPGLLQLGFILLAVGVRLWRFRSMKLSLSMRFQVALITYLQATLISNVIAFALIPDLLH